MFLGSFWRGRLVVRIHQFKPVLTEKTGPRRWVFLRSLILKIKRPGLLVWSFPVLVQSGSSLFLVLRPDFQTLVNFTALGINATFPVNAQYGMVSIVLGLHLDILDMIHNTWAILLIPDMHLFGGVIQTLWEQFKRPGLVSLGVFSSGCASISLCFLPHVLIKQCHDARQRCSIYVPSHSCHQTLPCKLLETTILPCYACT